MQLRFHDQPLAEVGSDALVGVRHELQDEGQGGDEEGRSDGVDRVPQELRLLRFLRVPGLGSVELPVDVVRENVHPEERVQEAELERQIGLGYVRIF